jgi:hypothetical protein
MTAYSDRSERKLYDAYARSNVYFPQLRFGFILALGSIADQSLVQECRAGGEVAGATEHSERVLVFANHIHRERGVSSVLPTSIDRVVQEINKSSSVFLRFLESWVNKSSEANFNDVSCLLNINSKKFWKIATSPKFYRPHLKFVADETVIQPKMPLRRVDPSIHPTAYAILSSMYGNCQGENERAYVDAISSEIIHPLTVMRPSKHSA